MSGKVAIVTGGSAGEWTSSYRADQREADAKRSGIGRASAIALGKNGWSVVITGRDEAKLAETAKEISSCHTVAGDLVCCLLLRWSSVFLTTS